MDSSVSEVGGPSVQPDQGQGHNKVVVEQSATVRIIKAKKINRRKFGGLSLFSHFKF